MSIPEQLTVSVEGTEAGTQFTAGQIELPGGRQRWFPTPRLLVVNVVAAPTTEEFEADGAGAPSGQGGEAEAAEEAAAESE